MYDVFYWLIILFLIKCVYYRDSCAIDDIDTQTVVITGGGYTLTIASVYDIQGWREDLQPLNIGRYYHACTSYMSEGSRVR